MRAPELPGVTADMGEVRVYPYGGAFAHVIGYVAKVNDRDVDKERERPAATPTASCSTRASASASRGWRRRSTRELRGTRRRAEGRGRRQRPRGRATTSGDIAADARQGGACSRSTPTSRTARWRCSARRAARAVMMDCRNGDILCMASAPGFDANRFVRGVPGAEYRALADYERQPLLDKALTGTYPPGSTFKMITGAGRR